MKYLILIGALAASFCASAITATKSYVDKQDAATKDTAYLAIYYPEGNVTNVSQITTEGLTYSLNDDGTATVTGYTGSATDIVIPWKTVIDGVERKVTAIGGSAFLERQIKSVATPTTVTTIGIRAFFECTALTSVSLPSVTSIRGYAFAACDSMKSVSVPSATSISEYAFVGCNSLMSVSLPSVSIVGDYAFFSSRSLKSVSLPSATTFGEYAFYNSPSLTSIDFGSFPRNTIPLLDPTAFFSIPTTCRIIVPLGMYDEWIAADGWKDLYAAGYKFVGYADAADIPKSAADVGAFPAASGNTLAAQVATIGAHLNAEDAKFVVTNYDSRVHMPEASVEIKLPSGEWSRVWREMTRWDWFLGGWNAYTNTLAGEIAAKADRAWGFYDSTTGGFAPEGYTWISSEKIAIAAGLAYQRTVTSEGAIWVLESNGFAPQFGGTTNGFFSISDDEGNEVFGIVKGDKRTVGADAASCEVVAGFSPTKLKIGYSIVSEAHPVLYVCEDLKAQNWKAETDAACVANVTWEGSSGAYTAYVQGKAPYAALFVKATYEVGGETYIKNTAPVAMESIIIGGVKYAVGTAVISGKTVLTLEAK